MAKVVSGMGIAVAHRPKDRHGPDGGAKPAAKYEAMLAAAKKASSENITDPAQARQMVLDARNKHRKMK